MGGPLEKVWRQWSAMTAPANDDQRNALEAAFYAGATAVMRMVEEFPGDTDTVIFLVRRDIETRVKRLIAEELEELEKRNG